ncbi:hypothetical protein [Poritiphilus flavus]|uniref:Uncharacterized protein n=1 Tax=Poritiphilus flavus TaxID=2697053 RepID=A0A6L9EEU2_9FLAO|nr:hypothetical protein [Poritiphilus flavus]NAS13284.1 hypothetical protein [Poritiphilus flavus]
MRVTLPLQRIILLWLLSFPVLLSGQEKLQYSGPLQLGKFKGEAAYDYKLEGNDTILDGPFRMQRSSLQALLENEDASFSFSGNFENNYPDGFWSFLFGEFQSDSESQIVDYQYRVKISGIQNQAKGNIRQGRPDGLWEYLIQRIEDSEVAETLFKSAITFEGGVPQKSFRIENETSTLVGRFLRNGLAHDIWSLYSDSDSRTSENWYFNEGWLSKIEFEENGEVLVSQIYEEPTGSFKVLSLDSGYLQILKLKLQQADSLSFLSRGIPALLAENAANYKKIDNILSGLGRSAFLPEFKVKAEHFPLDSLETARMDAIKGLYQRSVAISEPLLNNTQLNILRRSDEQAQFLHAVVSAISSDFLQPLQQLVKYAELDVLEFVPRDQLISGLWPNGKPGTRIRIDSGEAGEAPKVFTGPNASQLQFGANNLQSAQDMARYASISLDSIAGVLNDKLVKDQRQQDFISLEEQMIAQVNELNKHIDSVSSLLPSDEREALSNIRALAERRLNQYSSLEENSAKIDYARASIACFTDLKSLSESISKGPERLEVIQEKYQDAVWNPFIATIMNEEVKKRITAAYRKVLLPYFLDKAKEDLNCDNAKALGDLMDSTYERLLELRDESTSKLERKLRKEQDPEMILQLFNLPATDKVN